MSGNALQLMDYSVVMSEALEGCGNHNFMKSDQPQEATGEERVPGRWRRSGFYLPENFDEFTMEDELMWYGEGDDLSSLNLIHHEDPLLGKPDLAS
ncbi:MAG: hypothetical protein LBM23_03625 [Propionibacteriaceae bacterium]|jgi:hypothetical protein|nr:hypothetical protein [Propionibacteriaceae bacterium]